MDRPEFGYEEAKERLFTKEFLDETITDLYRLIMKGKEEYIGPLLGAIEQYEKRFGVR